MQANVLATAALQEAPTHTTRVALFPTAKCQLILDGISITRKIPQAVVCYQAGLNDIRMYLMERNKWMAATFSKIDGMAHGASHLNHQEQRCYLVKLCHHHLPTGQTLLCRDAKYPA
jgi:hypothetical protein